MNFSTRLKEARVRQGLTQETVAERLDVSRQTVSNWENDRSLPDLRSIVDISEVYQLSLDELLKGDRNVMNKLINDGDVKKANDRVSYLSIIVLFASGAITAFSKYIESAFASFAIAGVLILIMVFLIKSIFDASRLKYQFENQDKVVEGKQFRGSLLILACVLIIVIGFVFGFLAA